MGQDSPYNDEEYQNQDSSMDKGYNDDIQDQDQTEYFQEDADKAHYNVLESPAHYTNEL